MGDTYEEVLEVLSEIEKMSEEGKTVSEEHKEVKEEKAEEKAPEKPEVKEPEKKEEEPKEEKPVEKKEERKSKEEAKKEKKEEKRKEEKKEKPEGKPETKKPEEMEPLELLNAKIEALEREVKMLRESVKEFREKTDVYAERIGEIRGLVMERETTIREALISLKKMGEIISELDPMKLIKEKRALKTELTILQSKVEEYERVVRDLSKKFSMMKESFEALSDIHTILELGKDVGKKLAAIEEVKREIERIYHKIENMYMEINKRVEEFPLLVSKVEKLDKLSLEIIKVLDEYKVKMENFLTRDDLTPIEGEISNLKKELKKLEEMAVKRPITRGERKELKNYLKMLQDIISSIEATNSIIEEQYREALISEKAYNELIGKNKEKESALKKLVEDVREILDTGMVEDARLAKLMDVLSRISTA